MVPKRVAILGVGLLGGSLGLAVKGAFAGAGVVGYGHRRGSLEVALKRGAIDEPAHSPGEAVRGADLVVVAVPVSQVLGVLEACQPALDRAAVVTDVGSTKAAIVEGARRRVPRFVGSHPMAGGEKSGVAAARADLFAGATCVVTPTPQTDAESLAAVEAFWRALGMQVVRHTPDDHDRLVALVSHLPHAAASMLAAVQTPESLDLAGAGYRDTTRIAAGDAALWADILLANATHATAAVNALQQRLDELKHAVVAGDGPAIRRLLEAGQR